MDRQSLEIAAHINQRSTVNCLSTFYHGSKDPLSVKSKGDEYGPGISKMDAAILSASAGLIGSLIGGVSTFAASWLTQRRMLRTQTSMQYAMQCQALYSDFIVEASKRLTEAWSHQAEGPEVVAGLYSAVARMRLTSSAEIIRRAEQVIRLIIAAYADPNRTFGEFKQHVQDPELADPLRNFTEACREELNRLRA